MSSVISQKMWPSLKRSLDTPDVEEEEHVARQTSPCSRLEICINSQPQCVFSEAGGVCAHICSLDKASFTLCPS